MLNLNKNTKRAVFIFTGLYIFAGAIAVFDISGKVSNLMCGLLTIVVIICCAGMVIRAILLAKRIEKAPHWHSRCCCRGSAIQAVLGYALLMFSLGLLKSWTVGDLFVGHWVEMPLTYHAQSWGFLALSAIEVVLAWVVLNLFDLKYECAQIPKTVLPDSMILHKGSVVCTAPHKCPEDELQ